MHLLIAAAEWFFRLIGLANARPIAAALTNII